MLGHHIHSFGLKYLFEKKIYKNSFDFKLLSSTGPEQLFNNGILRRFIIIIIKLKRR